LIHPAATAARPHRIVDGQPTVDIGIAASGKPDWVSLDDLDPDDPDARIVAQILSVRDVPDYKKILLSQDSNPLVMAARHGIKSIRLPDDWLLAPEPSPEEKTISKLKGRVSELEATQPNIQFRLEYAVSLPLTVYRVRPYPKERWSELVSQIQNDSPKEPNGAGYLTFPHDIDAHYDDKYERYHDVLIYRYVQTFHKSLQILYGQVPFKLTLENPGHVQAENLILKMHTGGGRLHNRFALFPIYGPTAPKPKPPGLMPHLRYSMRNMVKPVVGRHEMSFAFEPNRSNSVEIHCQDFRHGSKWTFEGVATIDVDCESPFLIDVQASASNMRGIRSQNFELPYTVTEVDAVNLVDPIAKSQKEPFPMLAQVRQAARSKNSGWFQNLSFEGNWNELSGQPNDGDGIDIEDDE
jgi:hypothetical protein